MESVKPILTPNRAAMVQHLELLFGRALTGKIELTAIKADAGPTDRPETRFFNLDQIEDAADWAVTTNTKHMWNVYVGAALRSPDVFPGKAADDDDFHAAYAICADVDEAHDLKRVRERYRALNIAPPFAVVTGRTPSTRAQLWWPLEDPIRDAETYRQTLRAVAHNLGTDRATTAAKQLMRLGGGVAWPKAKKPGRILEPTEVNTPDGAQSVFTLEQIQRAFPPPEPATEARERAPEGGGSLAGAMAAPDLRSALASMRSDDRDLWVRMGHALKSLGDQGRGLWIEWSQTSDKYDPQDAARVWESLKGERTGFQAVFAEAQRQGWVNPATVHDGPQMREVIDPETGEITEVPVDEAVAGSIRASPYQWVDANKIPPRDILYGRHLFRKFLSATVAPGGLGKSSLEMVEALAMVTGRDLIGESPKGELRVWYWNGEDPQEELQRRIAAACLHYGITPEDLGGRLYVDSGRDTEIVIVRETRDGVQVAEPVVEAIIREIRTNGIDVLQIDPFVASHAVSENDNTKIEAVVRQWMRVAEEANCAVELVHHVRKPSGNATETTVDDARGAGALLAKVRSARVLNAMSNTEADELGIERKDRFGFFRVDNGKANLMPRGGEAKWRRMLGVPLGNRINAAEDEVGVATEWHKPSALEGVTAADLQRVKIAVSAGQWREDIRASNWVGNAIGGCLGVDVDEPQGRARVRAMLKTWLKTGALEVVQGFDESRRQRAFVIVGKGEE